MSYLGPCDHPKATITHGDLAVRVDASLAPLVKILLSRGIVVLDGCEDCEPEGWCCLAMTVHGAEAFVASVARGSGPVAERAGEAYSWNCDDLDAVERERGVWLVEVFAQRDAEGETFLRANVAFPSTDLWPLLGILSHSGE